MLPGLGLDHSRRSGIGLGCWIGLDCCFAHGLFRLSSCQIAQPADPPVEVVSPVKRALLAACMAIPDPGDV